MAKLEITGKVFAVGNTLTIPSKKDPNTSFYKRELILDTTQYDRYTGQRSDFENFPKFEFRNNNCDKLNGVKAGDIVKVAFDIVGRFYTNRDGQQSHMNSIDAFDVDIVRQENHPMAQQQPIQQQVQQPQMQQAYQPQQAYPNMQQPAYPQQGQQQGGLPF